MGSTDQLFGELYGELRARAASLLGKHFPGVQRGATSLVNDLWIRYQRRPDQEWTEEVFFATAVKAMRHALIDELRTLRSDSVALDRLEPAERDRAEFTRAFEEVHAALELLAEREPRMASLAEQRELSELTLQQTAARNRTSVHHVRRACEELRRIIREART